MNFYTYIQEQSEDEANIGQVAQMVEAMEAADSQRLKEANAKNEHKTWVNIIVGFAKNMDEIRAFNDAWRQYQESIA